MLLVTENDTVTVTYTDADGEYLFTGLALDDGNGDFDYLVVVGGLLPSSLALLPLCISIAGLAGWISTSFFTWKLLPPQVSIVSRYPVTSSMAKALSQTETILD